MHQYIKGDETQRYLLDYLKFLTKTVDNSIVWAFARKYRNNEDGSDIDFVAVADYYEAQPHQYAALKWLEDALNNVCPYHLGSFYQVWQASYVPASPPVVKTNTGSRTDDYARLYELMTRDGERIPGSGSPEESNIKRLILELIKLEKFLGVDINMTSGYRPEPINTEVGGVPNSEHTKGLAADCYSDQMPDAEFEEKASKYWLDNQLGGVGYGMAALGFTHLDLGEVRTWSY
jgi:hypothetical protein